MSAHGWREEAISKAHDRDSFDCGDPALNDFLRRHARKSHDAGGAKTFLAVADSGQILGFYSLSSASVAYARTPSIISKGLARHEVPCFRLARLAVDARAQGLGLGGQLLLAAGRRCLMAAEHVGAVALLIDAKSERVTAWYEQYGAVRLQDAPLSLLLSFSTIKATLQSVEMD